jgi:hypothetical protein
LKRVGTRKESTLHRELKIRYAGPGGLVEAKTDSFVADGIRADGEFIEVQIGSFALIMEKAKEFSEQGRLRIIHPIFVNKYLEFFDAAGNWLYRRKSARRGKPWDIFKVMVYAPRLPLIPGIRIELAMIDVTEKRIRNGKGSWRRKGVSIADRTLAAWHEGIMLEDPGDYFCFLPFAQDEEFTVSMLAKKAGITVNLARKTLYVLFRIDIVERVGKQGNAFVYRKIV